MSLRFLLTICLSSLLWTAIPAKAQQTLDAEDASVPKCIGEVERFQDWTPTEDDPELAYMTKVSWTMPEGKTICHAQYFIRSEDLRAVTAKNLLCLNFGYGRVACGTNITGPASATFEGSGTGKLIQEAFGSEAPTEWRLWKQKLYFPVIRKP